MDEPDLIDRAMSPEPRLEPSPGFAHRVMREVHRVAEEPEPIRFPWHLFAPGLAALGLLLVAVVVAVAQGARARATAGEIALPAMDGAPATGIAIAVASVAVSLLLAWSLARTRRRVGY